MADNPSATLAGIREDIEATADVYDLDGAGKRSYPISAAMVRHARVAVDAVERVLALADEAISTVGALHCSCAAGSPDKCVCPDTTVAWTLDPAKVREAISAALTGEERSDGK